MAIRVAIVEDSAGIRNNWVKLIEDTPGLDCVGACASAEEGLKQIPSLAPDVVLMDIQLPRMSGIECTAQLKAQLPQTQILIVTAYADSELVFEALQSGASGYLLKRTSSTELLDAIRDVTTGGAPMTGAIARKVIEAFRRPASPAATPESQLSPREKDILHLLAQGYANKEIADRLGISFDTVRTHLKHIYSKLHVQSRAGAAAKFIAALGRRPLNRPATR